MANAVDRLCRAIGYPERPEGNASRATLLSDGNEILATETGGRLRLVSRLTADASRYPSLAAWAAGRMLRESAVLSCDADGAFLWQDEAADAGDRALARLFETFADSCDWWRDRIADAPSPAAAPEFSQMVIRP